VKAGPAAFFALRILGLRASARASPRAGAGAASGDSRGGRYLRGAVLGVALSIVPLVVVLVVSDGMIQGITSRYIETGTYHLQAQSQVALDQAELEAAAAALRALPGMRAFPELQGYGVAIAGSRTAGVALRAVEPSFLADPGTSAYLRLVEGDMSLESTNQILLGEPLARNLRLKAGDSLGIVTQRPGYGGREASFIPKVTVFRVRGIVSAGYRELDALWAFVSPRAGARMLMPGSSRSLVGIKVERPFGNLEPSRSAARSALSADWTIETWPEAERNVFKSFSTTRALLLLVMALAVAVGAINVGSALVMLVLERRRDIAILKSAGASPSFIGRVFVLAGLALGGAGTLAGIGIGTLLAWRINDLIALMERSVNAAARLWASLSGAQLPRTAIRLLDPAYYLERIPVDIRFGELAAVAVASLVLCLLASLIPAGRASRLPPQEIFRKT
jgi:lipoprotein-releasing system permease protein